jgi:hypothetical protein
MNKHHQKDFIMYTRRSSIRTTMPNIFVLKLNEVKSKVEEAQALLEEANQMALDLPAFSQMRDNVRIAIANTIGKNIYSLHDTVEMIDKVEDNVDRLK